MLGAGELKGKPFLIFANKMDVPTALSPVDIAQGLSLDAIHAHPWRGPGPGARRRTLLARAAPAHTLCILLPHRATRALTAWSYCTCTYSPHPLPIRCT